MRTFAEPAPKPLIAASILSADFARMGDDCRAALDAGADLLHVDVMDGHFVPNLTMGPDMVRSLRRAMPAVFLDVHLMVTNPGTFIAPFADAGASHLTFHCEVTPARAALDDLAGAIRERGMTAGLAINPPTALQTITDLLRGGAPAGLTLLLIMSVNPGKSGQAFIPGVLEKTRALAREFGGPSSAIRIEMDGGIKPTNAAEVRTAGCDVIVSASALFGAPREQWPAVIRDLKG